MLFDDDGPYLVTQAGKARWRLPLATGVAGFEADWTLREERDACGLVTQRSVSLVVTTAGHEPIDAVVEQMTILAAQPIAFECRRTSDGAIVNGHAHLSLEQYAAEGFTTLRIRGETIGDFVTTEPNRRLPRDFYDIGPKPSDFEAGPFVTELQKFSDNCDRDGSTRFG